MAAPSPRSRSAGAVEEFSSYTLIEWQGLHARSPGDGGSMPCMLAGATTYEWARQALVLHVEVTIQQLLDALNRTRSMVKRLASVIVGGRGGLHLVRRQLRWHRSRQPSAPRVLFVRTLVEQHRVHVLVVVVVDPHAQLLDLLGQAERQRAVADRGAVDRCVGVIEVEVLPEGVEEYLLQVHRSGSFQPSSAASLAWSSK
jgi:hypothetical protein